MDPRGRPGVYERQLPKKGPAHLKAGRRRGVKINIHRETLAGAYATHAYDIRKCEGVILEDTSLARVFLVSRLSKVGGMAPLSGFALQWGRDDEHPRLVAEAAYVKSRLSVGLDYQQNNHKRFHV